jgi:ABC-type dipeptide/oligopeptide/nickel transport system permease component
MLAYILRRVIWLIPVMFAVSIITFVMMHLAPGGPWDALPGAGKLSASVKLLIAKKYHLDESLPQQYIDYISAALHGDLGPSYTGTRTVSQIIGDGFPISAAFGLFALLFSVGIGIPLGLASALRHNGVLDHVTIFFVTLGYSLPTFVIGIFAILIICVGLHIVPIFFDRDNPVTWILPVGILSVTTISAIVRLTRSSTLEILGQDYVRTARAKGLNAYTVNVGHVLRNALIPVVTLLGPLTANLIVGTFFVEKMFGIPGLGKNFVTSVSARDYALLMGVTLFYALIVVFFNLLVDLTYSFLDPRIVRS